MKPSIPKGTRDFLPYQSLRRKYLFNTIERVFKKYGYQPIETPALENLSTLTGKYGDEGDALLFKVLNNGDFLSKVDPDVLQSKDSNAAVRQLSKRGLRYDLTVPFARFVVMNQHEIKLPFKRYQIQPVWRADRPQKGRYQEFYQCDVDVVGSDSLMYEAELAQILDEVFNALGFRVTIKINNRKILAGIAEMAGIKDDFMAMTVAIDKLDKIGEEGVKKELTASGISDEASHQILQLIQSDALELKESLKESSVGSEGISELEMFYQYVDADHLTNQLTFDATLARGLTYYTGCIFEVTTDLVKMGSLSGGGRYADLTSIFGLKDVSGVGVSFGAERIYDVMEELQLWPEQIDQHLQILLMAMDESAHLESFRWVSKLREAGIAADLYPEPKKFNKQMKYANAIQVKYVGIMGSQEIDKKVITLKNMVNGEQEALSIEELLNKLGNQ